MVRSRTIRHHFRFSVSKMSNALIAIPGEIVTSDSVAEVCGAYIDGRLVSHSKRYHPKLGDVIIGVVVHKTADFYRVDIGSGTSAILSNVDFNGATKRHKPTLALGAPVLCYVTLADPHLDIELSCEDKTTQRDWSSGETLFGPLTSTNPSLLVDVPVSYSKLLQSSTINSTLASLSRHFKFEISVGANGKTWIAGVTRREVLAISKILTQSQSLTPVQVEAFTRAIQQNLDQN